MRRDADPGGRESKVFFSEEKKQKTFIPWARTLRKVTVKRIKVFWFFFSKKNRLPCLPVLPCLALAVLSPCLAPPAAAMGCAEAAAIAEREQALPPGLLHAIGLVEATSPWSIDVGGQDTVFPTEAAAIAGVRALLAQGVRSVDIGCFQINLAFHPDAFDSLAQGFDPLTNARAAARFLVALHRASGDWNVAIMRYHSADAARGAPYRDRVMRRLADPPDAAPAVVAGVHVWTPASPGTAPGVISMAAVPSLPRIRLPDIR
jgi:hypothetical protein